MARVRRNASLDELVQSAITPVVERLSAAIANQIAVLVTEQLKAELARKPSRPGRAAVASRARPRKIEMTKWVADRRARRVPNFVIELTGLKTKKQIVAKYGQDAAFEKGKPLTPEAKAAEPKRQVKAKPPTIRKNGKVAA
jgi:hypothetical protein